MDDKKMIKKLAIFSLIIWIPLFLFYLFLSTAEESMIMLVLIAICIGRPLLWISPFYLTVVAWIIGNNNFKKASTCLIINIILLAINFIFFYWNYSLVGGWY